MAIAPGEIDRQGNAKTQQAREEWRQKRNLFLVIGFNLAIIGIIAQIYKNFGVLGCMGAILIPIIPLAGRIWYVRHRRRK